MNVLSLFDGMSCGQIALERAGIKVDNYYASELDKYAIQVTQANYPNTKQLGDVTKWREWDIDWDRIDLVMGGSPCQGFSFAGKQLAFDDPRSALFFTFVDIVNHAKCKFLLENVRMKKEYLAIITEMMGVEPVFINSNLVSAQNRQRYYWTNIGKVEQPEDKGILLKDIIEHDGDYTYMSDSFKKRSAHILRDDLNGKAKSFSAMEYVKNGRQGGYIISPKEKFLSEKELAFMLRSESPTKHRPRILRAKGLDEKSNTITSSIYKGVPHGVINANPGAVVGRKLDENGKRSDFLDTDTVQCLEVHDHGKSRCLSTVQKDTVVTGLPKGRYPLSKQYRKLTPLECERLQTLPDGYTDQGVSNTQRYKMIGNGWTVDVIAHIFKNLTL